MTLHNNCFQCPVLEVGNILVLHNKCFQCPVFEGRRRGGILKVLNLDCTVKPRNTVDLALE